MISKSSLRSLFWIVWWAIPWCLSNCLGTSDGKGAGNSPLAPNAPAEAIAIEEKQKGAHVFAIFAKTDFQFLHRNNINWVTVVPWGFQSDYNSAAVSHHNGDSTMIEQSDSNWVREIAVVREQGFKVFMKPHIWLDSPTDGKWRSDIFPKNEADWNQWKNDYQDFILRYAKVAQRAQAEMFCIGTELTKVAVEKPAFWRQLIQAIREVYTGKITYAANWYEEYENITFWGDLDYIGIQAYFPLTTNKYPSVAEISRGWEKFLPAMESVHKRYGRQLIFTEIGYKSTADSAITPWEWIDGPVAATKSISLATQANCYEAFFKSVWGKKWFAGAHLWQMRGDYLEYDDLHNTMDFTPLGKPAEKVLAKGYE